MASLSSCARARARGGALACARAHAHPRDSACASARARDRVYACARARGNVDTIVDAGTIVDALHCIHQAITGGWISRGWSIMSTR